MTQNGQSQNGQSQAEQAEREALLAKLVGFFDEAEDASLEGRLHAERDRDYYDGRQWTATEEDALSRRGQAPIVVNRIKPKVDYLLGLERQSRTDPRCFPRNPADEGAAKAATEAIRFVLDDNGFDQVRSQVFEHMLVEGSGFAEVVAARRGTQTRVTISPIGWDRAFVDPHARRRDLEDARYRGQVIWMDLAEAQAKYPNHLELLDSAYTEAESGTYDDKPSRWADRRRRRVRVVECWYKEGSQVFQAVFCRGGILKGPTASPYRDDEGNPEDPYVCAAAFVARDGERYGAVRQMIGIQDEINKRRSKALHLLSVRQVRAEKGAVEDVARARRELARPDGWLETVPGFELEILPTGDMATAQFQLLTEAKNEIDAVGAGAAQITGAEGASGRAIQLLQQGARMELGPLLDTLRAWQTRAYRKAWGRIRQFWTEVRWVRVTNDERSLAWVGLNIPVTRAAQLVDEFGEIPPELIGDPSLDDVVAHQNHVAELDVDIIVGDVPDTASVRQEEFQTLARLAEGGVPIPPEALVEASSLRGRERILELMRGPAPDPTDAAMLQRELIRAEIAERTARAAKTAAEAARINAGLQMPGTADLPADTGLIG
ncbi:MAG: hypothetical protein HZA24_11855 [Nitrospirae bacterium]|nr:hypothetical protein [Nitrospirota bacterium]